MQIVNRTEVCVEYRKDLPIIVSVDLQPIAPLEGVVTIQVTAMINAGIALQRVWVSAQYLGTSFHISEAITMCPRDEAHQIHSKGA